MQKKRKKILGALLGAPFTTLAVTPAANATVISTGVIEVTSTFLDTFTFDFMIGGISASGHADEGSKYFRPSLYEGDTFNGNHDNRPANDMFAGQAAGESVEWRLGTVPFGTRFNTLAPGAVLTRGQTVYTSSFEFEGQLCGIKRQHNPCFIAFPNLTGQGIAEFLFDETVLEDGRHYFTPIKATYTFMPVPEPASVALFGLGLLGVMTARRSKRDNK